MRPITLGFAGMTHLGIVSGIAAAEKGFRVIGFDPDPARAEALERGELPISEPALAELLAKNRERLRFRSDAGALKSCDAIYVAPDVPTDDRGASDLGPVNALLDIVATGSRKDAVTVILSQVPPGFTRTRAGRAGRLFYQVETLIFGRAVERALHPERIIVGCEDPRQALPEPLAAFLSSFGCPVLPMRYESAELAKISINLCLVASVSVANTLAELCERIGADWSEIAPALRLDKRIGEHAYLAPGLGLAGGNLERDLATVRALADATGADAEVVRAFVSNSRRRRDWALLTLHRTVLSQRSDAIIAILGLAYKENTHSTKNSPALALLAHLRPFGVRVFDPLVRAGTVEHPRCAAARSALDACDGADALAIMTPWPQFRALSPKDLAVRMRGRVLLDPYRVLDAAACRQAGLSYHTLGVRDAGSER